MIWDHLLILYGDLEARWRPPLRVVGGLQDKRSLTKLMHGQVGIQMACQAAQALTTGKGMAGFHLRDVSFRLCLHTWPRLLVLYGDLVTLPAPRLRQISGLCLAVGFPAGTRASLARLLVPRRWSSHSPGLGLVELLPPR